jgi:cytochrome c-type biogenesis protein CcmF
MRRSPLLAGGADGAAIATAFAIVLAFAALIFAFVVSDFSVANVARNSHTDKPMLYKVSAAWGSHEGLWSCGAGSWRCSALCWPAPAGCRSA